MIARTSGIQLFFSKSENQKLYTKHPKLSSNNLSILDYDISTYYFTFLILCDIDAVNCFVSWSYLKVHSPVWDKGKENGENFHHGFHLIYFLFRKFSPIGDFGTVQQSWLVPLWQKKG